MLLRPPSRGCGSRWCGWRGWCWRCGRTHAFIPCLSPLWPTMRSMPTPSALLSSLCVRRWMPLGTLDDLPDTAPANSPKHQRQRQPDSLWAGPSATLAWVCPFGLPQGGKPNPQECNIRPGSSPRVCQVPGEPDWSLRYVVPSPTSLVALAPQTTTASTAPPRRSTSPARSPRQQEQDNRSQKTRPEQKAGSGRLQALGSSRWSSDGSIRQPPESRLGRLRKDMATRLRKESRRDETPGNMGKRKEMNDPAAVFVPCLASRLGLASGHPPLRGTLCWANPSPGGPAFEIPLYGALSGWMEGWGAVNMCGIRGPKQSQCPAQLAPL